MSPLNCQLGTVTLSEIADTILPFKVIATQTTTTIGAMNSIKKFIRKLQSAEATNAIFKFICEWQLKSIIQFVGDEAKHKNGQHFRCSLKNIYFATEFLQADSL